MPEINTLKTRLLNYSDSSYTSNFIYSADVAVLYGLIHCTTASYNLYLEWSFDQDVILYSE